MMREPRASDLNFRMVPLIAARKINFLTYSRQRQPLHAIAKVRRMRRMRRIFILTILLLLSAQVSWAAVSNYCQHEKGAAAQHVGHHAHQHKKAGEETKQSTSSVVDDDCAFCHFSSVGILALASLDSPVVAMLSEQIQVISPFPSSTDIERPERPKWNRAD